MDTGCAVVGWDTGSKVVGVVGWAQLMLGDCCGVVVDCDTGCSVVGWHTGCGVVGWDTGCVLLVGLSCCWFRYLL